MRSVGTLAAGAFVLNACGEAASTGPAPTSPVPGTTTAGTDELSEPLTAFEAVIGYNNYYEFSTDKEAVAPLSRDFTTSPWTVEVGGLVNKPKTYAMEDLLQRFPQEERVYRLRCVEGWSMVIPWMGFPINKLLNEVEPTSKAKYVRFETLERPEEMPGQKDGYYRWPYVEGLRLDEAMNDLAILATGLYGKALLPQNGAPLRLTVPWKYGFKSIKSIVKMRFMETQPQTAWNKSAPSEYGFYSNVNPKVDHPRWSQAKERRLGEWKKRDTLLFNGYGEVASMYRGLDLKKNF